MWDNVPWMVGGNVQHSVETARLLAYASFNGDEGVIGTKDLQVTALENPGAGVRVWPGACSILDRANAYNAYAARKVATEEVAIAPTGGSARNDLIIARIENPYYDGSPWPNPGSDPAARQGYPYIATRVISGVGGNVRRIADLANQPNYSAIPLALVTLPANRPQVTQNDIIDLRVLNTVRRGDDTRTFAPSAAENLTSAGYSRFPQAVSMVADIPTWCTHMDLRAIIGGARFGASGSNDQKGWGAAGTLRLMIGATATATTNYDLSNEGSVDRTTLMVGDSMVPIPPSMRGTQQTITMQGTKSGGSSALGVDGGTTIAVDLVYKARLESNVP